MRQALDEFEISTRGQGLYECTRRILDWAAGQEMESGLLTLFLRHTSASLLIQENIDPDVLYDMQDFFKQLVPEETALYRHTAEGADDQPAHIRAALTQTHLAIPLRAGRLLLGRYQGIFLFEHRTAPKSRWIAAHLLGE